MAAGIHHQQREERLARFADWLPDDYRLHVAVKRENDQWFALLPSFDITGAGETRASAVANSLSLLAAYLQAYFDDGAAFEATLRSVPPTLWARIYLESAVARLLRGAMLRVPPLTDETTYALPLSTGVLAPDIAIA